MKMKDIVPAAAVLASALVCGCFSVKTESEVKPIHITLDVNLKVDKELDKTFQDGDKAQDRSADRKAIHDVLTRGTAGFNAMAMLEERDGATEDDRLLIAETNAKCLRRLNEVAKSSGVTVEAVRKRRVRQIRERVPAGSWYRDDAGSWVQKK